MSERMSPEAERLVSAGRAGLAPGAEDINRLRGRILAGVAAGVAVTAAGGAGAAAASSGGAAAATGSAATAGGLGLVKVVVVAVAVTGASVTGGVLVSRRSDPAPIAAVRHEAPAMHDAAPRHRRVVRDPVVEPLPAAVPDAGPVSVPPESRQTRPARKELAGSLSSEMDLLRRARSALRAGDARAALEHLTRHADRFPDSPLAPEAAAIRIEATCAVGDHETARVLADQFSRRWPDSPLARRVAHLCGGEP